MVTISIWLLVQHIHTWLLVKVRALACHSLLVFQPNPLQAKWNFWFLLPWHSTWNWTQPLFSWAIEPNYALQFSLWANDPEILQRHCVIKWHQDTMWLVSWCVAPNDRTCQTINTSISNNFALKQYFCGRRAVSEHLKIIGTLNPGWYLKLFELRANRYQ